MTDAEQRKLQDIERGLRAESPTLAELLTGETPRLSGERRRRWRWAATLAVAVGAVLVVLAVVLGTGAFAVFALCPPLALLVLFAWERRAAWLGRLRPADSATVGRPPSA